MYVKNLKAEPNFCGGQIDLFWRNPSKDEFPGFEGVKIVRRERHFPEDLTDGTLIYPVNGEKEDWDEERSFSDKGLKGETFYYYAFCTYGTSDSNPGGPQISHFTSRACRISAMATSDYGMGERLYQLIPAIYKRYDTVYSPPKTGASPEDQKIGELQRLLEIFGYQLDLIRSFAAGMEKFFDLDECPGALLSLLAQWIGLRPNISLDYDSQRNEIRYAPEIYKTVGITANLQAFINRLTGWDCQIREFVHNLFMSNDPERLNIWSQVLASGNGSAPELLSLDYAYEGSSSSFVDLDGRIWLFYHAGCELQSSGPVKHDSRSKKKRIMQWDIYFKIFDNGEWSPGYQVTRGQAIDKYPSAFQAGTGNIWLFWSSYNGMTWDIKQKIMAVGREDTYARLIGQRSGPFNVKDGSTLVISIDGERDSAVRFRTRDFASVDVAGGTANATCAEVVKVLNRDLPGLTASTEEGNKICLSSNRTGKGSSLIIDVDASTAASALGFGCAFPNASNNNMEPSAFEEDASGNIWLFWSSRRHGVWNICYSKFDGVGMGWGEEKQLTSGLSANRAPAALFFNPADPVNPVNKIWVFWCRKGPQGWNIFYSRTKPDTDLNNDLSWNPEEEILSPIPPGQSYDNQEPSVRLDSQGNIWVFWSSNQTGWNIWYKKFDKESNEWSVEGEQQATEGHFTKRAPTAIEDVQGNIRLFFRSNKSITYTSRIYPNTVTLDSRYSGSTTIDFRNRESINKRTRMDDILHYTYDTGIENYNWYARNTVGIYLLPETSDLYTIETKKELIKGLLDRFLPVHLRAVIVTPPVGESFPLPKEGYGDNVAGWIWFHSWSEEYRDHFTVNFNDNPIKIKYRTWHVGIETGG